MHKLIKIVNKLFLEPYFDFIMNTLFVYFDWTI